MKRWLLLLACIACAGARADALQDRFNTVWESLWYQGGSPYSVIRWQGDLRVNIHGQGQSTHRGRIMKALEQVAAAAERKVIDVSDAADAAAQANLDVHLVGERDLLDNEACYVRHVQVNRSVIEKAVLKIRNQDVYYCILHEAMHVMGVLGHPTGDTVLSYFYQRVDALTELDLLMLRAWYAPAMKPGMTPLEAVVVLKRSGKAGGDYIRSGKTLMRYFLGLAHYRGTLAKADLAGAQVAMGYLLAPA